MQWDPRRERDNRPGELVVPSADAIDSPVNPMIGRQPYGQPIARVNFFRRMPQGGTAYLKPADSTED
ncbi:hypothetical protein L1857_03765 [Amycolatopsis thermalba]|uniref:Uncharacterized protein n=1 Tax=Amycolatopsis thermalba TaxID=944492 RepID=A0ABY4NNE0_9PSEU|nr:MULTISPECIES: hypothetical protein [Amycolatopsis]UQS22002.1 hypothetical protein L1857_03765 [Amycolatopsis thermalba]